MTMDEELAALLPGWLPKQRWFAAKGRPVRSVTVRTTPLRTDDEPLLDLALAAVAFGDDSPVQHYQVLVARREHLRAELEHVSIGQIGRHLAYDGLWDTAATRWLLDALRAGRRRRRRPVRG